MLAETEKSSRRRLHQKGETKRNAILFIEVENHGTADQIHDDETLIISNVKYNVQSTNTKYQKNEFMTMSRNINDFHSLV